MSGLLEEFAKIETQDSFEDEAERLIAWAYYKQGALSVLGDLAKASAAAQAASANVHHAIRDRANELLAELYSPEQPGYEHIEANPQ